MLQKFGERNDDHRGLGDWYVNENKIKGRRASGGSEKSGIPSDHERKN